MNIILNFDVFQKAFDLQVETLNKFYDIANNFTNEDLQIKKTPESFLSIKRNFFSTLFIATTSLISEKPEYLPLYAMVNQCMRAWVTACDNILDNEYKEIFPFNLSEQGSSVKSVLTLMIADRILTEYVVNEYDDKDLIHTVEKESLKSLLSSAIQESEEETRPVPILHPEELIKDIHQKKTADLFAAPLNLPAKLENINPEKMKYAKNAMEYFGLGCQIIDDMKDLPEDIISGRHNYIVSLICATKDETKWLDTIRKENNPAWSINERFPEIKKEADKQAIDFFNLSFNNLGKLTNCFDDETKLFIINFMYSLLGVPTPDSNKLMEN